MTCVRCRRQLALSVRQEGDVCKRGLATAVTKHRGAVLQAECFQATHHLAGKHYGIGTYIEAVEQLRVSEDAPFTPVIVLIPTPKPRDGLMRFSVCVLAYLNGNGREYQRNLTNLLASKYAPSDIVETIGTMILDIARAIVDDTITWAN